MTDCVCDRGLLGLQLRGADFGTDGAGSARYALVLTGSNVASGLFALDPADTTAGDGDGIGQGASIVLNKVGNDIPSAVGTTYFTISVDRQPVVTFTQSLNIGTAIPATMTIPRR